MTQQPPVEVSGAETVDITARLDNGCYLAQVRSFGEVSGARTWAGGGQGPAMLFATAATAPTDSNAWFERDVGESFSFRVGSGIPATWARMAGDDINPAFSMFIAIARTGA